MNSDPNSELPQALLDALNAAEKGTPMLTGRVDREIRARAQSHFAGRKRPLWQTRPAWVAVAASLLVAVLVYRSDLPLTDTRPSQLSDIDGSGSVDIVDLLTLARNNPALNQADLDDLARGLVSLSAGAVP